MYYSVFYRVILVLLCVGPLLGGCSTYEAIFHPHRLGTPAMSPEARAKAKAAEKARHKGLSLPAADPDASATGDGAAASGDAATPVAADKTKSFSELPAGTRATYDRQGLLKKSLLTRLGDHKRQLHHYDLSTPPHTKATRDARRMRTHPKGGKGKDAPEPKAPKEADGPAPDPTQPAEAPVAKPTPAAKAAAPAKTPKPATTKPVTPKAEKLEKAKPEKPKPEKQKQSKPAKKAPKAPKPDPTQPLNGDQ